MKKPTYFITKELSKVLDDLTLRIRKLEQENKELSAIKIRLDMLNSQSRKEDNPIITNSELDADIIDKKINKARYDILAEVNKLTQTNNSIDKKISKAKVDILSKVESVVTNSIKSTVTKEFINKIYGK